MYVGNYVVTIITDIRTERKIPVNDETRTILSNELAAKQTATRWVVFTSNNV